LHRTFPTKRRNRRNSITRFSLTTCRNSPPEFHAPRTKRRNSISNFSLTTAPYFYFVAQPNVGRLTRKGESSKISYAQRRGRQSLALLWTEEFRNDLIRRSAFLLTFRFAAVRVVAVRSCAAIRFVFRHRFWLGPRHLGDASFARRSFGFTARHREV